MEEVLEDSQAPSYSWVTVNVLIDYSIAYTAIWKN